PHGQQHGADDADRQRDLHERAAIVVLDADAPHVAFAHQFLDLADDRFTGDLELLGAGAPLALPGLAPRAGLLAGFRARLAGGCVVVGVALRVVAIVRHVLPPEGCEALHGALARWLYGRRVTRCRASAEGMRRVSTVRLRRVGGCPTRLLRR